MLDKLNKRKKILSKPGKVYCTWNSLVLMTCLLPHMCATLVRGKINEVHTDVEYVCKYNAYAFSYGLILMWEGVVRSSLFSPLS